MAEKFQNKYRIPSARASWWNYGDEGNYFVTICTNNKNHWFGEIEDGVMVMNEVGRMAEKYWYEIPKHFSFVELDSFVVMPNHVHGIIRIKNDYISEEIIGMHCRDAINRVSMDNPEAQNNIDLMNSVSKNIQKYDNIDSKLISRDAINRVFTEKPPMIKINGGITGTKNPMFYKNLSRLIRWYKGRVCFESRIINKLFAWQTRFHDHIIRSTEEYIRISHYICTNVENWEADCFYQNGMRI